MKIRTRLTASLAAMVILVAAVDILAVWPYRLVVSSSERTAAVDAAALAVMRVNANIYAFRDRLTAATTGADVRRLASEAAALRDQFEVDIDHAESLIAVSTPLAGDAATRGALTAVKVQFPGQINRVVALAAAGDWPAARLRLTYDVAWLINISSTAVHGVETAVAGERAAAYSRAERARQLFVVLMIATVVALLISIGLAWSTTRAITRPLAVLEVGAHALARGDFQHRVAVIGTHEFADLGTAFNYAASRIDGLFAERERAAEQLRQSRAELAHATRVTTMGELTASIAHEIRQPMTAVMTDVQTCLLWLSRDEPEITEAKAAAARAVNGVSRATEIISRIRSLFKKDDYRREPLDVNVLVEEMAGLLRSQAQLYGVSIQTSLDRELPQVPADRIQVMQALLNLMLNGIEAMRETSGTLLVTSRVDHGAVLVSVSDTGVGLPQDSADHLFKPFFTTKTEGTGMGLSISRSIVEAHGGRLWAQTGASRGATFCFTLPSCRTPDRIRSADPSGSHE